MAKLDPSVLKEGILHHLDHPVKFPKMLNWRCSGWSLKDWVNNLEDTVLPFRIGTMEEMDSNEPQWERGNACVSATLQQLVDWTSRRPGKRRRDQEDVSPFLGLDASKHWAYCAYQHIPQLFAAAPHVADKLGVDWSELGFAGRGAAESTLWIGTSGAHTLCHRDTYGCNLVTQLVGRKRWVMFPPSDGALLRPTRVPYEESTVFSGINLRRPDLHRYPELSNTHPHVVILEAGDTLFVPRHWWHLVENLETSISINTWLEQSADDTARLEEALAKTLISQLPPAAEEQLHTSLCNDPAEARWSLLTCLSTLRATAARLRNSAPGARSDKRAFWAAFRAWPGSRRVLPTPPSSVFKSPEGCSSESGKSNRGPAGDGPMVQDDTADAMCGDFLSEDEVFRALVKAVTDPDVLTKTAEMFLKHLNLENST